MIMADVFKYLFVILGTLITLVSYWLLFEACLPAFVERARTQYERRPLRMLFLGLAVAAPAVLAGSALAQAGNGAVKLVGVTLLLFLLLLALLGSTGFARLVGARLQAQSDEMQPWRRVLRGGAIVAITFVLPLLGWFVVLPAVLVSGLGATLSAWKKKSSEVAA
ncbi:MAG: hypothetical protein HYV26_04175 [Candidatus Hydrogenedentes bacterium]|nr:hypothetical protein [Candidatus Hydrogenedentota bacterium]MBI3119474.1 hypothetical protein [Candidatus Hydrogenedentota bacterium]